MTARILVAGLALVLAGLTGHSAVGQDRGRPLQPPKPAAIEPAPRTEVRIITLRDSDALEMIRTLRELYSGDDAKKLRLSLHQSTNSVIAMGPEEDLERINAIIMRLETTASEKKVARPDGKQPKVKPPKDPNEIKDQVRAAEADVEQSKERAAWAERMVKLGYASAEQGNRERARLEAAQIQLQNALRELAAAGAEQKPGAGARTIWEYKVFEIRANEDNWSEALNKFGADGWELDRTINRDQSGTTFSTRLIFRRAK
jgi:hypothetical protein